MSGADSRQWILLDEFNRKLVALTRVVARKMPEDPQVNNVQTRVATGLSIRPLEAINLVGDYFYKFNAQIYKKDDTFFIENSFEEEIQEGVDPERIMLARLLMPKLKECARKLESEEKNSLFDLIIEMLDIYLEWRVVRGK